MMLALLLFICLFASSTCFKLNKISSKSLTSVLQYTDRLGHDADAFRRQRSHVFEFKSSLKLYSNGRSDEGPEYASIDVKLGIVGTVCSIVCLYSLYILRVTSCGLPPGPFGLLGAAEGTSYLVIMYVFFLSLKEKFSTGSGLPAGRYNLLGLAEGLSFVVVFLGLSIAVLNYKDYGFLPGFLPNDQCFGIND